MLPASVGHPPSYVYSAYYDWETHSITIMAIRPRKSPIFFCQLWYLHGNQQVSMTSVRSAETVVKGGHTDTHE